MKDVRELAEELSNLIDNEGYEPPNRGQPMERALELVINAFRALIAQRNYYRDALRIEQGYYRPTTTVSEEL